MTALPARILSALKDRGTCSAYELGAITERTAGSVLAVINKPWGHGGLDWIVEKIAGPTGFLYRLREVESGYVPQVIRREYED